MSSRRASSLLLLGLFSLIGVRVVAQKGGQSAPSAGAQPSQAGTNNQGASSQGLQGFSFAPEEWPLLDLPNVRNPIRTVGGRTVVCYKLTKANSSSQPFILQRINLPSEVVATGFDRPCGKDGTGETDPQGRKDCIKNPQPDNHWNSCSTLSQTEALLMGQELVVGIDVSDLSESGVNINQVKLLNINVTTQQSTPLNPSPVRPSFPGTGGAGATASLGYG